jgi:hypothetical protein
VIFVWEGTWLHVNTTSLEWALFDQDQVTLTRTSKGITGAAWGRAPGGFFGFGADGTGDPRHRRISAVVYGERVWQSGNVYARLRVYHHPFGATALPRDVFGGIPQCVPTCVNADEATLAWDTEPGLTVHLR